MNIFQVRFLFFIFSCLFIVPAVSGAAELVLPSGERAEYFYVFGPDGEEAFGKDDAYTEFLIDFPLASSAEEWSLFIFDPDTSGFVDHLVGPAYGNTEVEYQLKGTKTLDRKKFGSEEEADGKWFRFGAYSVSEGARDNDVYRFVFSAKSTRGNDQNLFKIKVVSSSASVWAKEVTLTSSSKSGSGIFLYPELQAGENQIVAENLNLDRGAFSVMSDPATGKSYQINHVSSADWQRMELKLGDSQARRLNYMIKPTQRSYRNAGVRFLDSKGKKLPIYFEAGDQKLEPVQAKQPDSPAPSKSVTSSSAHAHPGPVSKCNQFTFDARESYDLGDKEITYEWDFGDGHTSDQAVMKHAYEKSGTYRVTLKVSNHSGLKCETAVTTQDVIVNMPPVAKFEIPNADCTTNKVLFDAAGTTADGKEATNLKYYWDFGDGNHAEGMKAEHTYVRGGKYPVTLTVDDGSEGDCAVGRMQKTIALNAPPVAKATLTDQGDGASVSFDATASYDPDGDEIQYAWDFGDGQIRTYPQGVYKFRSAGNFPVKLTVKDSKGLECSEAILDLTANVKALPKPKVVDKRYYDKRYFDKSKRYDKYMGK